MAGLKFYIDPERFIEEIKKRPELWSSTHKDYRNKFKKTSAWFEICEIFDSKFYERSEEGRNACFEKCTGRWRNMRDQYLKCEKRKNLPKTFRNGQKTYIFSQQLSFLQSEYSARHRELDGLQEADAERAPKKNTAEQSTEEQQSASATQKTKRKLQEDGARAAPVVTSQKPKHKKKELEVDNSTPQPAVSSIDEDKAFFDSFLPIIRTFTIDQKLEMRSQFLNLVRSIRSSSQLPTQFFPSCLQAQESSVDSSLHLCPSPRDSPTPLRFTPDPLMSPSSSPDVKTELD